MPTVNPSPCVLHMKASVGPVVLKQEFSLIRYPPGNTFFLLFVGI